MSIPYAFHDFLNFFLSLNELWSSLVGKAVCIWRPFAVGLKHMRFSFIQNKSYLSTLRPLHYMNQSIVNQAIKRYFKSSLYMN